MSSQEPPKKKSKQVENKQETLLSWVKPCTSDTGPGVVEETIRIKEQPGNVMLATNAVSERSFSPLKLVKTYLRSTTGDSRLNHLMMLHVHKDRTDALTLVDVANDFVGEKENRKQLFGKFSSNDIPNKFSISSKSTQTEN